MQITSSAFQTEELIPSQYSCDGGNINPPLHFSGVPVNAKSLVLMVDDPDAPVGLWVHWLVWNIGPHIREITENSVPAGAIEGTTSAHSTGYHGPCPPDREHRYFFKLYALDTLLELPASTRNVELEQAMQGHILDRAELMGRYDRKR